MALGLSVKRAPRAATRRAARYGLSLVALVATAACGRSAPEIARTPAESATPPQVRPTATPLGSETPPAAAAPVEPLAPPAPDGDPARQFLVHMDTGELTLRTRGSTRVTVLAPHADGALYDPGLELVWYRDKDVLRVLDLRAMGTPPVAVVRDVPQVNRFSIERADHLVETEDNCDLPEISVHWTEAPAAEALLSQLPSLPIVDAHWLRTQLARPVRATGARRELAEPTVRLPKKRMRCEDAEACGATARFGARGWRLVQTRQQMGGDCWHRACLLQDPQTGRFATPPHADRWSSAADAQSGPCGLYLFDREQTSFLVGDMLCEAGQPCVDLGGRGLGWRVPGDVVGSPGIAPD